AEDRHRRRVDGRDGAERPFRQAAGKPRRRAQGGDGEQSDDRTLRRERSAAGDQHRNSVSVTRDRAKENAMIVVRARHPGAWTAIGAAIGTAIGTALGNSPIGLALGAGMGVALAMLAARPAKRSG